MSTPEGQPDGPDDGYVGRHHADPPPPAYPPGQEQGADHTAAARPQGEPPWPAQQSWPEQQGWGQQQGGGQQQWPEQQGGGQQQGDWDWRQTGWQPQPGAADGWSPPQQMERRSGQKRGVGLAVVALVLAVISLPGNALFGVFALIAAGSALKQARGKVLAWLAIAVAVLGLAISVGAFAYDRLATGRDADAEVAFATGWSAPTPALGNTPAPGQESLGEPDEDGHYPLAEGDPVPLLDPFGEARGTVTLEEIDAGYECCSETPLPPENDRFVGLRLSVDVDEQLARQASSDGAVITPFDFRDPRDAELILWGNSYFCLDHRFGLPDTVEPGEVGSGWLVLDVAEDTETVTWEMVHPDRGLPFAVDVDE